MALTSVHVGRRVRPRRTMLYGTPGIGKSTFGAMADAPIFIPTEDGLADIDCASYPLATSYNEVMERLAELYTVEHDRKTVVIDSLDWLERLVWAEVCTSRGVATIEDIGYGKGYQFAMPLWSAFLAGLIALRDHRGMSCILIAHSKIEKFDNPETESYDRYSPQLHKTANALITEWCDDVLFATHRVYTTKEKGGFNKERTRSVGEGERVIRTTARPACFAKNHLNLPEELPLDYREYAKFFLNLPSVSA